MIDAGRARPFSRFGIRFAALGAATVTYAVAFVAGCGSGQDAPPNTAFQGGAESIGPESAGSSGGGGRRRHAPPPEAFEACKDKSVGSACTVAMHDREISGQCESPPPGSSQTTPSCRPTGGARHREHHGPPPEIIFAACDGKAAGDACTVNFERGTVQGSCMAPKRDAGAERLLCAAAHARGHEPGGAGGAK